MKIFLCLFSLISISIYTNAQITDSSVSTKRYESAYIFISNPKNLKKADKFFKKISIKNYPPNVLYELNPISLMMLSKKAINEIIRPDTIVESRIGEFIIQYDKENYFEPVKYFSEIEFKKNDRSQLYIVFSKPKEDYLIAELHIDYYNKKPENYQSFSTIGSYFKMLFVFDESGNVKKLYCNKVHQ
jgi:hypothetical protein